MTVKYRRRVDTDTGETRDCVHIDFTEGDKSEAAEAVKASFKAASPAGRMARIAAWHAKTVEAFDPGRYPELREVADLLGTPKGDYQLIAVKQAEACRERFERRRLLVDASNRRSNAGKRSGESRREDTAQRDALIRQRHAEGKVTANIARSFGLSTSQIRRIIKKQ